MGNSNSKAPKQNKVSNFFHKVKAMWKTPPEGRFLNFKEMGCFGIYALGVAFMTTAVNYVATVAFIPQFYRIGGIHGYIIMAVASFINMCILPFIANKIEKTNTKWGRYKPYILFLLPLYAVLVAMVTWIPQLNSVQDRTIYAYMTCIPMLIANGFFYNMYQTMPTIITSHAQERADIMTPLGLIFGFAPSILQIVAGPIRSAFMKQNKEYMALRIIGIISVVLGIICVLFILKVKERVYYISSEEDKKEKVSFVEASKMLAKNKPLIILTIALILGSLREFTGQFRMQIIQCRFAEDATKALDISGLPMTIIGFAATVSMLLLPLVTRKMDKKYIIMLFGALPALCNVILAIVGYERIPQGTTSLIVITIIHFIMQITPLYLLIPIMLGEIADYQQYKTGKRLDGHIQNLLFTVPLLASQVFMIFTYFWQQKIGFEPSALTEAGVKISASLQQHACEWFNAVSIISAVSGILMVVVIAFYPLSRKKHSEIVEELKKISVITNVEEENGEVISFGEEVEEVSHDDENNDKTNDIESDNVESNDEIDVNDIEINEDNIDAITSNEDTKVEDIVKETTINDVSLDAENVENATPIDLTSNEDDAKVSDDSVACDDVDDTKPDAI